MNNVEEFLNSVTVVDVETTHIAIDEAEIVELAACRKFNGEWNAAGMMFGTARPIPPEASAVHHISNKMIAGLAMFPDEIENAYALMFLDDTSYMVAHNSDFDRQVIAVNAKKTMNRAPFEPFAPKDRWICTWRLAKAVFGVDNANMKYNLSYLRYALDLEVPAHVPAHRADADTFVCGLLLDLLVNKAVRDELIDPTGDIGQQLYHLCWAPKIVKTWPFGKHKGKEMKDVPLSYLQWAVTEPVDRLDETHQNYDSDLAHTVMQIFEEAG